MVAGLVAAIITIALLGGWSTFAHWYVSGSAFTDLPGQDSLALVHRLELPVGFIIALVAGRTVGVMCIRRKWLGVLIGVCPLTILFLVAAEEHALEAWPYHLAVWGLGLGAAYLPSWRPSLDLVRTRGRRTRS